MSHIRIGDMQTYLFANDWRTLPPVEELHFKLTPSGLSRMDSWQADRFAALEAQGIEWNVSILCPASELVRQGGVEEPVLIDALDALLRSAWCAVQTARPKGHCIDLVCGMLESGVYEFDFYDDGAPPDPELLAAMEAGGVYGFYTLAEMFLWETGASLDIIRLPKEQRQANAVELRFDRKAETRIFSGQPR